MRRVVGLPSIRPAYFFADNPVRIWNVRRCGDSREKEAIFIGRRQAVVGGRQVKASAPDQCRAVGVPLEFPNLCCIAKLCAPQLDASPQGSRFDNLNLCKTRSPFFLFARLFPVPCPLFPVPCSLPTTEGGSPSVA